MIDRITSAETAADNSSQYKLQRQTNMQQALLAADYIELTGLYGLTNRGFVVTNWGIEYFLKIKDDFENKIFINNVGKLFKIRIYAEYGAFYENSKCIGKLVLNEPISVNRLKP